MSPKLQLVRADYSSPRALLLSNAHSTALAVVLAALTLQSETKQSIHTLTPHGPSNTETHVPVS